MSNDIECRVKLDNICVNFHRNSILSNISMILKESHIYGLISKNGLGKTTLLKVIAGILAVSDGSLKYGNGTLVGYAIEDSLLINGLTVEQNIIYYTKLCGIYDNFDLEEIIELVGIQDYRKKYVKRLSKGMRQRTSIAISLIRRPNLLLWDEAISGVDFLSRKNISEKLSVMSKKYHTCVVTSDHNINNLLQICDDFIFLKNDGSISIFSKKELFNGMEIGQNQAEQKFIDILEIRDEKN